MAWDLERIDKEISYLDLGVIHEAPVSPMRAKQLEILRVLRARTMALKNLVALAHMLSVHPERVCVEDLHPIHDARAALGEE